MLSKKNNKKRKKRSRRWRSGDKQRFVRPSISLWMAFCHVAAFVKGDNHAKLSGITRLVDISAGGERRHEYSS
jgi:hypothetical protein